MQYRNVVSWKVVADFAANYEHTPRSADDLFNITLKWLYSIKGWLENGDNSLRAIFKSETRESEWQKVVSQRLRELSSDRYSVEREPEVDNDKMPDIRTSYPGLSFSTVEIKRAAKWSTNELEATLTDQIAGQ